MWTKAFWKDTAERAIKTASQTAVALFAGDTATVLSIDWVQGAAVVGTATLVSVLTSIASTGRGNPDSPSLVATKAATDGLQYGVGYIGHIGEHRKGDE